MLHLEAQYPQRNLYFGVDFRKGCRNHGSWVQMLLHQMVRRQKNYGNDLQELDQV